MEKLVNGIIDFQKNVLPQYRETFSKLALFQSPDTLFVACSDSRVVPNLFASSDPGDLFVFRNVGNIIPPCDCNGHSKAPSASACLEFSVLTLKVKDIIICGHSDCGAIRALIGKTNKEELLPGISRWLENAKDAYDLEKEGVLDNTDDHFVNYLSKLNVISQMNHVLTYPYVKEKFDKDEIRIHGWFFDLESAKVLMYKESKKTFIEINEEHAPEIIASFKKN